MRYCNSFWYARAKSEGSQFRRQQTGPPKLLFTIEFPCDHKINANFGEILPPLVQRVASVGEETQNHL